MQIECAEESSCLLEVGSTVPLFCLAEVAVYIYIYIYIPAIVATQE